ncbi:alpha/beta hydrolase family protein [Stieleria neptunia]|nr:alpha/beta hydrolase [Stieleria neptunia]
MFPSIRIFVLLVCVAMPVVCMDDHVAATDHEAIADVVEHTIDSPEPNESDPLPLIAAHGDHEEAAVADFLASSECCVCDSDRVFLISTRHLTADACRAPLVEIPFRMWRIDCGSTCEINQNDYLASLSPDRPVVFYVHGNRMPVREVVSRSAMIRNRIRMRGARGPIDWMIYSWPSEKELIGVQDFRLKADRCDAQGLYLASFLRQHVQACVPMAMIGYSFGARVTTGALHALAGGTLSGRQLPEPALTGANVRVGLVAPAIESKWLGGNGYHRCATKNMDELVLLYNRRDVVLKRYWLLEKIRRDTALGYSGPTVFASRVDGTRLPVRSRDCASIVKLRHSELDYYQGGCNAGVDMARLINGIRQISF